ncbi:serine/threonine-protein kinase TNNI3K-like, partial [Actinia tenebrosa]|uniref:Serine/threonine-protein kinase TNNI3K-like n=1 Tax=Actinia tenebrosa TaxID=6105 RepID=A0A6P8ICM6_ACTTE
KQEKVRHKAKKREEERRERLQLKSKLVSSIGIQTDQVASSQIKSRGAQMVIASRERNPNVVGKVNTQTAKPVVVSKPAYKSAPLIRNQDLTKPAEGYPVSVGEGSFGTCEFMFYRGNIPVVVKSYKSHVSRDEVNAEASSLMELQKPSPHPCLPLLLGIHVADKPYLLVTQFHGNGQTSHTVSSAIRASLLESGREWYLFLEKLVKAVSFMHSKQWLHNDIKHNNVVCHLSQKIWQPVLIDFGKSLKFVDARKTSMKRCPKDYPWIAPEIVKGEARKSIEGDVFSLGYLMKYVAHRVAECRSAHFSDLYNKCMSIIPSHRPSLQFVARELH